MAEISASGWTDFSLSQRLARFATDLRLQDLPAAVVSRVKHFFIDYLGIALRASSLDSSKPARALAREQMIPGQATLLGAGTTGADYAALANGMAAHSMELDDTFLEGSIHNESFLYAATMALAEECGLSGPDFIAAIVAGFEASCRIAKALQPAVTNARGFHPTGTCGAIGAAVAAGKLLGLNERQMTACIGIACSQASGLLEYVTDGSWTKRFHAGWAAHAGIVAARLAKHGMTGPRTAIEGKFGFLHAYSGQPKLDGFDTGIGEDYLILRTAMKYYPCNYYIQAINDSVLKLAARDDYDLSKIASIVVHTVQAAMHLVCEPIEQKRNPKVMIDAQFSVPFNVALGLLKKRVVFPDFTEQLFQAQEMHRLMDKVTCVVDPALDALYPETWPASVEIIMEGGQRLAAETRFAKGAPRNLLTEDEVVAKHKSLVLGAVDDDIDDRILRFIFDLEHKPDFAELSGILRNFVLPIS